MIRVVMGTWQGPQSIKQHMEVTRLALVILCSTLFYEPRRVPRGGQSAAPEAANSAKVIGYTSTSAAGAHKSSTHKTGVHYSNIQSADIIHSFYSHQVLLRLRIGSSALMKILGIFSKFQWHSEFIHWIVSIFLFFFRLYQTRLLRVYGRLLVFNLFWRS